MTRTGVKKDVCEMYEWFTTADDGCGFYLVAYYDLHKRVTLYINGPKMYQEERVDPRPSPLFGFGKLLSCPVTQKKHNHVKRVRVFCGIPFCDGTQCGGCKCDCTSCIMRKHDKEYGCKCIV